MFSKFIWKWTKKKNLILHLVLVVRCTDEKSQIHRYFLPSLLLSWDSSQNSTFWCNRMNQMDATLNECQWIWVKQRHLQGLRFGEIAHIPTVGEHTIINHLTHDYVFLKTKFRQVLYRFSQIVFAQLNNIQILCVTFSLNSMNKKQNSR